MLLDLKEKVLQGNKAIQKHGLTTFTWGNLSAIDTEHSLIAIKPSGVSYGDMTVEDIVLIDLYSGLKVEGENNPSSDTPTHLELYRSFPAIKSIVHTHSTYATSFAQALKCIKCFGTTHADYFWGDVPVVYSLGKEEIKSDYEQSVGKSIIRYFDDYELDVMKTPAALVPGHGPFVWGDSIQSAIYHAVVLEEVAQMNYLTIQIKRDAKELPKDILDKHYSRKHGENSYYGQRNK